MPLGRLLHLAILQLAAGDGPPPVETAAACNPFNAYQYLRVSSACCVSHGSCSSSWDLYEVEVFQRNGGITSKINPPVVSDSGVGKGRTASLAVNNNLQDYWEGDYDVGLSCSCWDESKVGGQWMVLDLGAPLSVNMIRIHQGGWGNEFAVSQVQVECSNSLESFPDPALRFEVSKETTTLECNSTSCEITECRGSSCSFASSCDAAALSSKVVSSAQFGVLAMVLALST
ncbi:ACP5 [Symbiodinium sp. CCMP2592]|nr:ACP5 [Symbiodinium sp. CCMP2592]